MKHLLFLGTETYTWSPSDFTQAALFSKAHGVDTLLVKAGEDDSRWYGSLSGYQQRRDAIRSVGLSVIPYWYSLGNTHGHLDSECSLILEYLSSDGIVCSDMESEWNGHTDWAHTLASRLSNKNGLFLCSTWADPAQQNWMGVLSILNPIVDYYLPQQYTTWLASQWQQFGGRKLIPTVSLSSEFGPNDAVANARASYTQKCDALSVWHYGLAVANPGALDAIWKEFPTTVSNPYDTNPNVKKEFDDCWNSTSTFTGPLNKNTGIHSSWAYAWWHSNIHFGPPLTAEYPSCTADGKDITCQEFARGRCEWQNGIPTWYGAKGVILL